MKRVTFAVPDLNGTYVDSSNNHYALSSGMYSDSQIAQMSEVWTPALGDEQLILGSQASPSSTVGVCYHSITQAVEWLGLRDTNH